MKSLNTKYNWKRFWCPREGKIILTEDGFLDVPDSEKEPLFMNSVVSFESIPDYPILILLGEPGIGKSNAIESQKFSNVDQLKKKDAETLFINLNQYGSETRLYNAIFKNPILESWIKGNKNLYLFLDSLDECMLRIDTVVNLLINELEKLPIDRLYVRIACRTADWPDHLEKNLIRMWHQENVSVYELVPLSRRDIVAAAEANGIDSKSFLKEIISKEAVPFAIKPITLGMLINMFRSSGKLPSTQKELYLKGCKLLCEETSESWRASNLARKFSKIQRFQIASRIAAVMVFANKSAVWTGIDLENTFDEDLKIEELIGYFEDFEGARIDVTEAGIRETLSTGLFSSRGRERIGWSHKTYAEYLSAYYLTKNNLGLQQVKSLLHHLGDTSSKLIPQLRETAAWVATLDRDYFEELVTIEPEVLLLSDVASRDNDDKKKIVQAILGGTKRGKQLDLPNRAYKLFHKLNHPNLSNQLEPFLSVEFDNDGIKKIAMEIASNCQLDGIENVLLESALDSSQSLNIRIEAANAIKRKGSKGSKLKLEKLISLPIDQDPYDELKGIALLSLWPKDISMRNVFKQLSLPRDENLLGTYYLFTANMFKEWQDDISLNELSVAFDWIKAQKPRHEMPYMFGSLIDDIFTFGWNNLESENIAELFSSALLCRLMKYDEITRKNESSTYWDTSKEGLEKRKLVLNAMLPLIRDIEDGVNYITIFGMSMFVHDDLPWLLEKIKNEKDKKIQEILSELLKSTYDWQSSYHLQLVYSAAKNYAIISTTFQYVLNPVILDSDEGERLKKAYFEKRKRRQKALLDPPPEERIDKCLKRLESGDLNGWWHLNREMTLDENSTHYGDELISDLTALPGWSISNTETKERIVSAAKMYVLKAEPENDTWLGTKVFHRPSVAGYRALNLLLKMDTKFIDKLEVFVWTKWAASIIAYPISHNDDEAKIKQQLIKFAYSNAPDETTNNIFKIIDKEIKEFEHIFILGECEQIWDDNLSEKLLQLVKKYQSNQQLHGNLMGSLLRRSAKGSVSYALSLISDELPKKGRKRENVIEISIQVMLHTDNAGWSVIWPLIKRYPKFGQSVVLRVSDIVDMERINIWTKLREGELSDLFIWLEGQFPRAEDPNIDGAHMVGSRENIGNWRDSILAYLEGLGTNESCESIRKLVNKFPEHDWLMRTLFRAEKKFRQVNWMPHHPHDIIKLVHDSNTYFIDNGYQLLDLIMESLKSLEEKLQGETPQNKFLWNETARGIWQPKPENDFSDYIKIYLQDNISKRGIVLNREVEISRPVGSGIGNRTDIHIDAIFPKPRSKEYDIITAIIEVKGCWNKDLNISMENQLYRDYMKQCNTNFGIYLIGWFSCDKWDNQDYKKRQTPSGTIAEIREKYSIQSVKLNEKTSITVKSFVIDATI